MLSSCSILCNFSGFIRWISPRIQFYQQDYAPPHYAAPLWKYLECMFLGRWIERYETIEWLPRSTNLTLGNFFLWRYPDSKIYNGKPWNLKNSENWIRNEMPEALHIVLSKNSSIDCGIAKIRIQDQFTEHLI